MRLGSETGSVMNHLYSRMTKGAPLPSIGMGATMLGWTDRYAGTVIGWDEKRGIVSVQSDFHKRTDSNGFSENQEYEYTPNPDGSIYNFRLDEKKGWREVRMSTSGRWVLCQGGGRGLILGRREEYRDPCF